MVPVVPCFDDPEPSKPILFNLGPSSRPWNFTEDSIKHIDGLPFSGICYNLPATFTLMHSVQYGAWTEQDLHDQFGDLKFSFDNVDQNWVSIVVRRNGLAVAEGDFFDDEAWAVTVNQFRLLARVAKTARYQCTGIFFDNEEYFEHVWNYPDDVANASLYSLEEYQAKAMQRGREVFLAIQSEWPEARIMFTHGPYRSAPEDRPFEVSMNQVGGSQEFELDAPFFYGMAAKADAQQVIDGGEVYQLRTAKQFRINHDWRSYDIAESVVVPKALRARGAYSDQIGISHGLYNLTWPTIDDQMSPAIMRTTLRNAVRSSQQPVWIFIESDETWLLPDGIPKAWRVNIERGFNDALAKPGDMNKDKFVNSLDILGFAVALGNGDFQAEADVNFDGRVNSGDILSFVRLLFLPSE